MHPRTETRTPNRTRAAIERTPLWTYAVIATAVAVTITVVATQPWLAPTDLVRDSQVIAAARGDANPAYGLVSNLGIMVTLLAAGHAATAVAILRRGSEARRLLGWSLALSLVVAADDLLLLHEAAAFGPGSSTAMAVVYAAGFLVVAVRFRTLIFDRLDPMLLALTFLGLGTSATVDVLVDPATTASVLAEDGAKLLGLLAWALFVVRAAILSIRADREDHPGG